jgi:hypothetical protein
MTHRPASRSATAVAWTSLPGESAATGVGRRSNAPVAVVLMITTAPLRPARNEVALAGSSPSAIACHASSTRHAGTYRNVPSDPNRSHSRPSLPVARRPFTRTPSASDSTLTPARAASTSGSAANAPPPWRPTSGNARVTPSASASTWIGAYGAAAARGATGGLVAPHAGACAGGRPGRRTAPVPPVAPASHASTAGTSRSVAASSSSPSLGSGKRMSMPTAAGPDGASTSSMRAYVHRGHGQFLIVGSAAPALSESSSTATTTTRGAEASRAGSSPCRRSALTSSARHATPPIMDAAASAPAPAASATLVSAGRNMAPV